MDNRERIDRLRAEGQLSHADWRALIALHTDEDAEYARRIAEEITLSRFGSAVFFRGLIEFSNVCRNDCLYCGIRRSNAKVARYTLTDEEILRCCAEGYALGYRTFVLQSGENGTGATPRFLNLIREIRARYSDCAVTLSLGEYPREAYEAMFAAGAERYLLRHETANAAHYARLHPAQMSLENRLRCLRDLRDIGFQTGCGMMVGTPGQSADMLAEDMEFMSEFRPEMAGIGPFLPQRDTPFAACAPGDQELTLFLLSLTRILLPNALIPATTALGSAAQDGRVRGLRAGCNVLMPNLSPENTRQKYRLYDNKAGTQLSARESLQLLKTQLAAAGRVMGEGRGDYVGSADKNDKRD